MAATHEYVDLGLTSKTLWAKTNLGASTQEAYGNYYAWGETTTKSTYSWSNYKYCSGTSATVQDIGKTIYGTSYDAARTCGAPTGRCRPWSRCTSSSTSAHCRSRPSTA